MLLPQELAALPDGVVQHFEQLEADLLADIARRIRKAGTMTPSAEWQLIRMQELGAASDFLKRRLRQTLGVSRGELDALYEEAAERSARFDEELLNKVGKSAADTMNRPYITQMLNAARNQAGDELENLTRTTAFRLKDGRTLGVQRAYERALDYTQWQVMSGGVDAETAIRRAVKELSDSGLRTVHYASGVQRTIEAAVRACVVTGIGQLTGQISEANADALGTDIVEVTAHPGARPEHAEWQGKWFSLRGDTPEYPNLAKATGYGTAGGLKGTNCRHDFHPVIPGLSQPAYTDEELKNLDPPPITFEGRTYTFYEATQKQRQIERSIRQSQRRLMGYEAAGLEEDYTTESVRLRRLRKLYGDFSKTAGLPTQPERARAAGWGRRDSARAAWKAKQTASQLAQAGKQGRVEKAPEKRIENAVDSGIMGLAQAEETTPVHTIGTIDTEIYKCVTGDIDNNEVIITDERIAHIQERHPNDYERYVGFMGEIVKNPDYILEANKPKTAFILKEIEDAGEHFQMILRLHTSDDYPGHKNSVITFLRVKEKRYQRYLRTKKILYSKE